MGPLDCDIKQMGLSGASPLGEVKTKAPNSDYHNHRDAPPVAARQAEVARDYLKRAARIDELNGHPPGSDGPMDGHRGQEVQRRPGAGLRGGRVRGNVRGREPHL